MPLTSLCDRKVRLADVDFPYTPHTIFQFTSTIAPPITHSTPVLSHDHVNNFVRAGKGSCRVGELLMYMVQSYIYTSVCTSTHTQSHIYSVHMHINKHTKYRNVSVPLN